MENKRVPSSLQREIFGLALKAKRNDATLTEEEQQALNEHFSQMVLRAAEFLTEAEKCIASGDSQLDRTLTIRASFCKTTHAIGDVIFGKFKEEQEEVLH